MLGWLTPDLTELSNPQNERSIVLPGDLFYLVTGALSQLADAENWEQFGDATPEETADFFLGVLEDYLVSDFRNVGMIAAFAANAAIPSGWIFMSGQAVAQSDYPELVDNVPSSWLSGSDIILPDARNRVMVGNSGVFVEGTVGGSNTHTLTINEMPSHSHIAGLTPVTAAAASGAPVPAIVQLNTGSTNASGNGQPHNNMPAYLAVRWCIYAGR